MSDGYVNLNPILNEISRLSNRIDSNLNTINDNVGRLYNSLAVVSKQVDENYIKLQNLVQEFEEMRKETRQQAALQRALTELVRVRQELQQNFGTQQLVRNHMIGILQANDLALITKTTISQCTEQLMISAPDYWLAPALVALAAWISDNKSLANRAVKEAIKRDAEKTYLLFALITRRVNAGRIKDGKKGSNICFIWLSKYFALQNPYKMTQSIVTYVDCYSSGIFGVDKDNICEDQINHWLDEIIGGNEHFAEDQKNYWLRYFNDFADKQNPTTPDFRALKEICPDVQYNNMINYYARIRASEDPDSEKGIKSYIKKIKEDTVDKEKLIKEIDFKLKTLVNNVEENELELRRKELYLQYVKDFNGDEEKAKEEMRKQEKDYRDVPIDFVARLNQAIKDEDENASISAKKTALALVKRYIKEAYMEFILETKDKYPRKINLKIEEKGGVKYGRGFTWSGYTENCENKVSLMASLVDLYKKEKKNSLSKIDDTNANKKKKTNSIIALSSIGAGFVGIIMLVMAFIFSNLVVGLLSLIPFAAFGVLLGLGLHNRKKAIFELELNNEDRKNINSYYDEQEKHAVNLLSNALHAREIANKQVFDFKSDKNNESIEL